MVVYYLATYDGSTKGLVSPVVGHTVYRLNAIFGDLENKIEPDIVDHIVQEAIVDTVGLDVFFGRFGGFLRDKHNMTPRYF